MLKWIIWGALGFEILAGLPTIPKRLKSLKKGILGIKYLPITLLVAIGSATGMIFLSEILPFLKWGWLGYNFVLIPIEEALDNSSFLWLVGGWIIIILVCFIANYWEEEEFRKNYYKVGMGAFLHLLMGIPLWGIVPVFLQGVIYKYIYDKHSLDHAFVAHFATNLFIITIGLIPTLLYLNKS
ncbi:hypothetical protein H5T58_03500 [Candidatus Parcubacteria bacterium]|nr:hypothetical protein [Candidatus Parcubacteria bacterium]